VEVKQTAWAQVKSKSIPFTYLSAISKGQYNQLTKLPKSLAFYNSAYLLLSKQT